VKVSPPRRKKSCAGCVVKSKSLEKKERS